MLSFYAVKTREGAQLDAVPLLFGLLNGLPIQLRS